MRAKFEEKTYENYFNTELDTKTDIYFPLGQVQEGNLGFDSSGFSRSRSLWRTLNYPFWFKPHFTGVDMRDIADEMELFLGKAIDDMPRMKVNLLFQYKRPEYINRSSGSEWKHWESPYFRYDIYREQQELLMEIHNKFKNNVLILYAAPAVIDVNDLVTKKRKNEIIKSSNFQLCSEVDNHHRNTFIEAGTFSIACSEPELIKTFNLIQELEGINDNIVVSEGNNRQFIVNFANAISSVIRENKTLNLAFNQLNESNAYLQKYELFYSHLKMASFRELTGAQWLVKL